MKYYYLTLLFVFFSGSVAGQSIEWANEVRSFSSQRGTKQFSANQSLGKPNAMPQGGISPCAWEPLRESNNKGEFIYVRFKNALFVKQVIVCESRNPGSIVQIDFINTSGDVFTVFQKETAVSGGEATSVFNHVLVEQTKYKVKGVKLYLQTSAIKGFNAIDAIGIAENEVTFEPQINLASDMSNYGQPENLSAEVNSVAYEFLPQISSNGKKLYYSRRYHPENNAYKSLNEEQGVIDDDIWISEFDGTKWGKAQRLPEPLNNNNPNAVYTVTPDGNSLLLSGSYNPNSVTEKGVSYSYKTVDGWSFPTLLKINGFYNAGPYSEFYLGTNKKTLLMTLVREEGFGDNDIYVSFINKDKSWSVPKNLGAIINTAGVESSPFLAADNKTVYFSSDGFSGYGKRDLYVTKRLDDSWTNWTEPVNLGSVINSDENESYYSIPASGEYAYFVSSKKTLGKNDIFRVKLPNTIKPAPVSLISGRIIDKSTGEVIKESLEIDYEILPEGIQDGTALNDPQTGEFSIVLAHKLAFGFRASKKGYYGESSYLDLSLDKHKQYEEITNDLFLVPLQVGQKILLRNVGFDQGKSELVSYSVPELSRLVKLLKENPQMIIRLEGHTEAKGYQDWNLKLSRERVDVVKAYLVAQGVKITQLETKGYGGSQPLYPESENENNRRVEFEILAI